jgi:hypothetical protein
MGHRAAANTYARLSSVEAIITPQQETQQTSDALHLDEVQVLDIYVGFVDWAIMLIIMWAD